MFLRVQGFQNLWLELPNCWLLQHIFACELPPTQASPPLLALASLAPHHQAELGLHGVSRWRPPTAFSSFITISRFSGAIFAIGSWVGFTRLPETRAKGSRQKGQIFLLNGHPTGTRNSSTKVVSRVPGQIGPTEVIDKHKAWANVWDVCSNTTSTRGPQSVPVELGAGHSIGVNFVHPPPPLTVNLGHVVLPFSASIHWVGSGASTARSGGASRPGSLRPMDARGCNQKGARTALAWMLALAPSSIAATSPADAPARPSAVAAVGAVASLNTTAASTCIISDLTKGLSVAISSSRGGSCIVTSAVGSATGVVGVEAMAGKSSQDKSGGRGRFN